MKTKILIAILSVAVTVLIASLVIILGVLYPYFANIQKSQLKDELGFAARATELIGERFLERLGSDHYRLTWVAADGTVKFDSQVDASTLGNHSEREEIKEAFAFGRGNSTRRSVTLTEQTIYEAVRLNDGTVLRISINRKTIPMLLGGMLYPFAVVLVIAIALSLWLAHGMSRKIVEPLNRLDLENPDENDVYEELSPLLRRINVQHLEINRQMRTLKQKQDEFDQIIGYMKEGLVLLDNSGRILNINPSAKAIFGAGEFCVGEDFLTVDRKQNMRSALDETRTRGHADFRTSMNGREYQFELSRIDSDEKHHGTVILAFDVTEKVNAEKNRQEFTANVSHELKTPLQSIIGSVELIENGIVKQEDISRFLARIHKEASRLILLIDDIIRLSQLDEGTEMPQENVSLRELSEDVCDNLSDAAKMTDVSLKVSGDDGVVSGNRKLLYEIIYNLCDNAIKYNKTGGSVKVSITQNSDNVLFSVHDTGIGISPQHHDKIFERFYRVDKSHSRQSGGTGLGLSIVKHAVQYHHAKITLESELNMGTTISISFNLPVKSAYPMS